MTVEEARALMGDNLRSQGSQGTESAGPTGAEPETEPDVEVETLPDTEPEAATEAPEEGAPEDTKVEAADDTETTHKGPPKMLPYERFREENRARKAAEARAYAAEQALAGRANTQPAPTVKPKRELNEDQKWIREAVTDDLDEIKADNAEVRQFILEQKDEKAGSNFWTQPHLDSNLKDEVEWMWQAAKDEARKAGAPAPKFTRQEIYIFVEGQKAIERRQMNAEASDEQRQVASKQQQQLATVNKIARTAQGGTSGPKAPIPFEKMTRAQQEKALENVVI